MRASVEKWSLDWFHWQLHEDMENASCSVIIKKKAIFTKKLAFRKLVFFQKDPFDVKTMHNPDLFLNLHVSDSIFKLRRYFLSIRQLLGRIDDPSLLVFEIRESFEQGRFQTATLKPLVEKL